MKYLKPVNFYLEFFKDILIKKDYSKPGRLLGLDVSDKYVSLAVSDWKNLTAVPLRALDRQENNLSPMAADLFQSLVRLASHETPCQNSLQDSRALAADPRFLHKSTHQLNQIEPHLIRLNKPAPHQFRSPLSHHTAVEQHLIWVSRSYPNLTCPSPLNQLPVCQSRTSNSSHTCHHQSSYAYTVQK
ncbi:hypothetical protein LWI29_019173 [Acer saccharum]|uniref:YqgF/RNase H-like domain-containing protein n=1 Tax=Acer saccharum TaxID=4024 RepID=A0AA39SM38_ACESA|nr:hypothetical protein LWI29_019173 [Acer saccharum]